MSIALEYERAEKLASEGNLIESQARKVISEITERYGGHKMANPTIDQYLHDWLETLETRGNSNATQTRYGGVVEEFLKIISVKRKFCLTALTADIIEKYMNQRRKNGCSPTTIRTDTKILRAAFSRARKKGLLQNNPAEQVDLPAGSPISRGTFTPAEVEMLISAAEGEWPDLIMIGYFTGQRLNDLCNLKWSAIDLQKQTITFQTQKTNSTVVVPIHQELLTTLEALASCDTAQEFVLPHMAGLGVGGRHGLSEGFKRIVVKAGLDLGIVQGGGKRMISKRSFHALRHSFISALANANVSSELRMKLAGHKSEKIHSGYTHLELTALKAAMDLHPGLKGKTNETTKVMN